MAVLSTHFDVGALGGIQRGFQIGVGNADHHTAAGILDQGDQLTDQGLCLGAGLVHLPVAGDNRLAQCFIHTASPFYISGPLLPF